MRTIIRKWFWAWDFDKEEAWLNEMASEGLALVSVGWCRYEFEPCEPGEYIVRQICKQFSFFPCCFKICAISLVIKCV